MRHHALHSNQALIWFQVEEVARPGSVAVEDLPCTPQSCESHSHRATSDTRRTSIMVAAAIVHTNAVNRARGKQHNTLNMHVGWRAITEGLRLRFVPPWRRGHGVRVARLGSIQEACEQQPPFHSKTFSNLQPHQLWAICSTMPIAAQARTSRLNLSSFFFSVTSFIVCRFSCWATYTFLRRCQLECRFLSWWSTSSFHCG